MVIWWTCNLEAVRCWWFETYRVQDFCNVHLFHGSRSWTGSGQVKPSMTFIRGKRCVEPRSKTVKGVCTSFKYAIAMSLGCTGSLSFLKLLIKCETACALIKTNNVQNIKNSNTLYLLFQEIQMRIIAREKHRHDTS